MAARGHFVFPIDDKNHRVLVIWDLNGYGKYEFDRCICDKVMACTSVGVRRRRRNQNHNITEIFKFWGYNYLLYMHILNENISINLILKTHRYRSVLKI